MEKELAQQASTAVEAAAEESGIEQSPLIENSTEADPLNENPQPAEEVTQPSQVVKKVKALYAFGDPSDRAFPALCFRTSQEALKNGPGWYEESVYPGEGNTAQLPDTRTCMVLGLESFTNFNQEMNIYLPTKERNITYAVQTVSPIAANDWSVIAAPTKKRFLPYYRYTK